MGTALFLRMHVVEFRDELPENAMGKVLKDQLVASVQSAGS